MTPQSGKTDVLADIVERLRKMSQASPHLYPELQDLISEAAAEIERLRRPTAPSGDVLTDGAVGAIQAVRRFLTLFVADTEPAALIVPDNIDADDFTAAYDEASKAASSLTRPSPAHGGGALRKALEPFAKEADEWEEMGDTRPVIGDDSPVTVGDLRRARSALASSAGEPVQKLHELDNTVREALVDKAVQDACELPGDDNIPDETKLVMDIASFRVIVAHALYALSAAPPAQAGLTIQYKTDEDNS